MSAFRTVSSFVLRRRLGLALAFCLAAGAASAQQGPALGEPTTQRLSFKAGANMVSLHVYPDDRSMASVFGPHRSQVVLAKDAGGKVYAPAYGVEDLEEWPWAEALLVYARVPFTVDVTGAHIDVSSGVSLERGWSWIPYFPDASSSPQDAFASLGSSLSKVEDVAGRVFPRSDGKRPLESIEPGMGYRVRLSSAAELVYGAPPADAPPADPAPSPPTDAVTVQTIEGALALQGLTPGQTVVVEDPIRGGTFVVRDSGAPTDGGTVFVPTEFTEETSVSRVRSSQTLYSEEGIVFESLKLFYGSSEDEYVGAVHLHGHGSSEDGHRLFEPDTGVLRIPSNPSSYTLEYRYATSGVRLERVIAPIVLEGVSTADYVRPEWWGAVPYPSGWTPDLSAPPSPGTPPSGVVVGDPVYDATDRLATAISTAGTRAAVTGREHYVVLAGMYGYSRIIELQDKVVLKGEIDGLRSDPGDDVRQGLRVLKGAPWHKWAIKQSIDPSYAEPRTPQDHLLGGGKDPFVVVVHGRLSTVNRIVDLEFDGNVTENEYVLSSEYRSASGEAGNSLWPDLVAETLQNTSHWNAFSGYASSSGVTIKGSSIRIENAHFHDYGGNIILGYEPISFGGSHSLKLGNSVKNHILYRTYTGDSQIEGVEIYGYSWASYVEFQQGNFLNVTAHHMVDNPWFEDTQVIFGHRNDGLSAQEIEDNERGYYFGDDVSLSNVVVDLQENRPRQAIFGYDTARLTLADVVVKNNTGSQVQLFNSDQGQSDQVERSYYQGDDITIESGEVQTLSPGKARVSHVRGAQSSGGIGGVKGVRYRVVSPGQVGTLYDVGTASAPYRAPRPVTIRAHSSPDATIKVYVQRAHFEDVDQPLRLENADASDPSVQAKFAVYWRDVDFSRWSHRNNYQLQHFERVTSRAHGSRTSEAGGSLSRLRPTANGDGRFYVDIEPGLFFTPQADEFVQVRVSSGPKYLGWASLSDWDSDDPALRLYFDGSARVTATWTAAIRPVPASVIFPE